MFLGAEGGKVGCQVQGGVGDGGGAAKVHEAGGGGAGDECGANDKGGAHGAVRAPGEHLGAVCEAAQGNEGAPTGSLGNWICHG